MKTSKNQQPPFYSDRTGSGKRMYYIDIKKSVTGSFYLSLCETSRTDQGFHRQRILVFNNDIDQFANALNVAFNKLQVLRKQMANQLY